MEMLYPSKKKISKRNEVNLNEDKITMIVRSPACSQQKVERKTPPLEGDRIFGEYRMK